jgi:choline dehydrogenase-like flavoprotein
MVADFLSESRRMLESAGCTDIETDDNHQAPGLDIHEMGGVRMGLDPETSLLDEHNALHKCRNVFVTDGACMTSTGNQSPSILYMALTARASAYAAEKVKGGRI